jgi:hypothetical protein
MIRSHWLLAAATVALSLAVAFGQTPGNAGPAGGGAAGGMVMFQRTALDNYVAAIAELNMDPDFALSTEQKKLIKVIRGDYRKAVEDFVAHHKDEIDAIQQAIRDATTSQDQVALQDARQRMQPLRAQGPKPAPYIAKVKAVLTPEQAGQVETQMREVQAPPPQGGPGRTTQPAASQP